jgi:hypothetical protein
MTNNSSESTLNSTEQVITAIRKIRDTQIKALLDDATLLTFAETHFSTIALSPIKTEFLKRDLKELTDSSLDLVHYSALVRESKDQGLTISGNHPLFLIEIFTIFAKYGIHKPE